MCIPNIWVLPTPVKNVKSLSNIPGIAKHILKHVVQKTKYLVVHTVPKTFQQRVGLSVTESPTRCNIKKLQI